jgi:hypothetical protein
LLLSAHRRKRSHLSFVSLPANIPCA